MRIVRAIVGFVVLASALAACAAPRAQWTSPAGQGATTEVETEPLRGVELPAMPPSLVEEQVARGALGSGDSAGVALESGSPTPAPLLPRTPEATRSPVPQRTPASSTSPQPWGVPQRGTGTFTSASGGTSVVGDGSQLVTYQVQMEGGIPAWTPETFAAKIDLVLADTRSWRASHTWSFQRVSASTTPSLYIRLATPDTVDYLCGQYGIDTQGMYSCRYGKYVIINLLRWTYAVPGFGVDIPGYRAMVTNHEVGHFLGYGHMACPGTGKLAPVMQTQTIALNGCLPNPWPYPDGVHFVSGPAAPA